MENKTNNHNHSKHTHKSGKYPKPIHHNWLFWVGVILMLLAIIYYVMSDDFTILIPNQAK